MKIKYQVLQLLQDYPELRDLDGHLSFAWYYHYFDGTLEEFVKSNIQCSIRRYRQDIQHEFPFLRGNIWNDNQAHAFKERKRRQQEKVEDKRKWYKFFTK